MQEGFTIALTYDHLRPKITQWRLEVPLNKKFRAVMLGKVSKYSKGAWPRLVTLDCRDGHEFRFYKGLFILISSISHAHKNAQAHKRLNKCVEQEYATQLWRIKG